MNSARRKIITALKAEISAIIDQISNLRDDIDQLLTDEQEAFDSRPESLQGSENGQASEIAMAHLQDAIDLLDNLDLSGVDDLLVEAKS